MCGFPIAMYVVFLLFTLPFHRYNPFSRADGREGVGPRSPRSARLTLIVALHFCRIVKHHGGSLLQEEGEQGVTYAHLVKDEGEERARGRPGRPAVLRREDTE